MPPEKIYNNLTVKVIIYDTKTDEQENEYIRNIDSADRRKWLLSTVMWAIMNAKAIEIINVKDEK